MKKLFLVLTLMLVCSIVFAVGEGTGTASISPLNSTTSTTQNVTVTFTNGTSSFANGKLYMSIPTGFTAMSLNNSGAGGLSITAVNGTGVTFITNGKTVSITAATLNTLNGKLIIQYRNAVMASTSGVKVFNIKSDPKASGSPLAIDSEPSINLNATPVPTATITKTKTVTSTPSITPTITFTKTITRTSTITATKTITPTSTITNTLTNTPVVSPSHTPVANFPRDANNVAYNFPVYVRDSIPQFFAPISLGAGKALTITPSNGKRIFIEDIYMSSPYLVGVAVTLTNTSTEKVFDIGSNFTGNLKVKYLAPVGRTVHFYSSVSTTLINGSIIYREE